MTLATPVNRIASIDILRAVTMLLMIFVNDLWSLTNIPLWLEHVPADHDGMGLADVVFPAFLFIVGMSLPFAVSSRRKKGDSNTQIVVHVVVRALALLVMGLFLVNGEYLNETATGINRSVWYCLSCLSFILIWNLYPPSLNRWLILIAKGIGVLVLLGLAFICRSGEGENIQGFDTYWWGILGLIGWAYLVCGVTFVYVGQRLWMVIFAWVIFSMLCVASHSHVFPENSFITKVLAPLGGGAMPALVMGGVVLSMIYLYYRNLSRQKEMLLVMLASALGLLLVGFLTRPYWGISKIGATPSWVWICSALTILVFICVYWLADIKGKANWFDVIKPAGTNTLLCYLIPYFAYALVSALDVNFPEMMLTGIVGLIKSLSFAFLVVIIAGGLGKVGIQLKL
jgi:heparan-alpha-glucosaminide N-acetyltransferase